jgi:pimeloyl-ACP methyl ester carboxylesterase
MPPHTARPEATSARSASRTRLASPLAAAARLEIPVLLIHGANDRATPVHHSQRLAAALHAPHKLLVVPGFGHDGLLGAPGVWDEVQSFLASID